MSAPCKAANPSTCRFHAKGAYAVTIERLEFAVSHSKSATTLRDKENWEREIAKIEVARDASVVGLKKLTKELQKSIKSGTVEEQAGLVARLKKASALRMRDGYRGEWDRFHEDYSGLGDKIIELSKTSDTVKIPWNLTGTATMGFVAEKLQAEGYVVTRLSVQDFNAVKNSEDTMELIRQNALKHLNENGGQNMFEHLDAFGCGLNGMKFTDLNGREKTLVGDIDMVRDEQEKAGY